MRKISREDIVDNATYLSRRDERIHAIIALKKRRRVGVGPNVSLTFENRETVISQIQEMMRVENITDENAIAFEIRIYNDLIPDEGELSASLFIEIDDMSQIRPLLDRMIGLDRPGVMTLRIGDEHTVPVVFEEGHSEEDRISAVHYVRFRFDDAARAAFLDTSRKAALVIDHPNYRAFEIIPDDVRAELIGDLGEPA